MDPLEPRRDAHPDAGSPGLRTPVEGESSSTNVPLPPGDKPRLSDKQAFSDEQATYVPEAATLVDVPQVPVDPNATLVDVPASTSSKQSSRPPSGLFVSAAILQTGDVLAGRYEILQLLGEGGMGAVYKARDRELNRFVALKLIRPELASSPAILARFKQELLLAHQVTHRNVIRIYDLAEADGVKFITMEFIEGADLRSILLDQGKVA